jgi:hypothetical protein
MQAMNIAHLPAWFVGFEREPQFRVRDRTVAFTYIHLDDPFATPLARVRYLRMLSVFGADRERALSGIAALNVSPVWRTA